MRRGGRLPADQAEVIFSDILIEQLEELTEADRILVLAETVALCSAPGGKHPLRAPMSGWNTLDVLASQRRVVYKASVIPALGAAPPDPIHAWLAGAPSVVLDLGAAPPDPIHAWLAGAPSVVHGVGLIEAICLGPRRDSEIYDMATALVTSGRLSDAEATQLWVALALLDVAAETAGLDGWDYRPAPAPEGLQRAAVAAGLLDGELARLLSIDEIQAAMTHGCDESGRPDRVRALTAALTRARGRVEDPGAVMRRRGEDRCGALMPRAQVHCIRRVGHPGPHRAS